ncbi:MAG: hypothetical protein FWF84_07485, partial [Kiritimatiellaeota bacterium]|nr:hypothetical protein [Kiritimatiellota bacterium]
ARTHGFRCGMHCYEMGMMPESFFLRHPALRGPRVDNPICSRIPHYAMCPMLPEVQDHYRQLTRKMMALVPELDIMTIFTNDSAAGFCYSPNLYSGPNGPVHCRDIPSYVQARTFCTVIAETARSVNPAFDIIMTSGMSPKEKALFIDGAPPGVASDVYGALAWGGGLEDHWLTMEVGPKIFNNPTERATAREWAWKDFSARVAPIRKNGSPLYVNYSFGYYVLSMRPYECYEIMAKLTGLGADGLLGGAVGDSPYGINTAVVRRVMDKGVEDRDAAIRAIAEAWVGAAWADALCEGWKLSDHAEREWPMHSCGGHAVRISKLYHAMPLVPDEDKLGERDLDYFMTPALRDEQAMKGHQGGLWRIYYHAQEDIEAYLTQYETVVFPTLEKAMAIFEDGMKKATGETSACFKEQYDTVGCSYVSYRRLYHALMATLHRVAQYAPPAGLPSFAEIIDREIALCEEAMRKGWGAMSTERLALMRQHRNDPVKKLDFAEFTPKRHPGLNDAHSAAHLSR